MHRELPCRAVQRRYGKERPESLPWTSGRGCPSGPLSQEALGERGTSAVLLIWYISGIGRCSTVQSYTTGSQHERR
ncbi:hypothetical protein AOLI_G00165550 [Acnodon oligacanthus]